jgi:ABC-type amino acid transport system permease subunit
VDFDFSNITVSNEAMQNMARFELDDAMLAFASAYNYGYDSLVAAVNVLLVDMLQMNNFSQVLPVA